MAIEYELIKLGLRIEWLGSPALSWRDLKVIVHHLPPDSALGQAFEPDRWQWADIKTQLLASMINIAGYQSHLMLKKRSRYRPLIDIPNVAGDYRAEVTPAGEDTRRPENDLPRTKRRRTEGATVTEIDAWLARRRDQGRL